MADSAIEVGDGRWVLTGELDFDTVPSLLQHRGARMEAGQDIAVDLAGVTRVDSAGLALMIEWLREAERNDLQMTFINVPGQLQSMAQVCGLDDILFRQDRAQATAASS